MRPGSRQLLAVLLLASVARAGEDDAWRGDNRRNERWTRPVIEWVDIGTKGCAVHLRHPGRDPVRVRLDGPWGGAETPLSPGGRLPIHVPIDFQDGAVRLLDSRGADRIDGFGPFDGETLTVGLLVERRTYEAGNRRFGSFVRRMRKSLEDLHLLLEDGAAATPGSILAHEPVSTRFRIQQVEVYDRRDGRRPASFDEHPDVDLVIACDEGGPLAGFWLPQYSIGHNFAFGGDEDGKPRRGLWSAWGEQALWHELLHFRGVPDSYVFHLPKAALPGRAVGDVDLPERFRLGIMNSPYQEPRVSALAAAIVNAKHGVRRVGACEEPDHEHGHMWRWIPKRIAIDVRDHDEVLEGTRVRWWRSRPMEGLGDPRRHGVPAGIVPDVDGAREVDAALLGCADARSARSLYLLVEVERGSDTRWDVIRLLELNEAWAAGHRDRYVHALDWSAMRPVAR